MPYMNGGKVEAEEINRLQTMELTMHRMAIGIENLERAFLRQCNYKDIPQYCTLRKAAELKGGKSYENLAKAKWFQPMCGRGWVLVEGLRCWTREAIIEWLGVTDDRLEAYAEKCGVDISKHFKDGRNIHE